MSRELPVGVRPYLGRIQRVVWVSMCRDTVIEGLACGHELVLQWASYEPGLDTRLCKQCSAEHGFVCNQWRGRSNA